MTVEKNIDGTDKTIIITCLNQTKKILNIRICYFRMPLVSYVENIILQK